MSDKLVMRSVALCFIGVSLYFLIFKQIIMPIVGITKPAIVAGFQMDKTKNMTDVGANSSLLMNARKAYARFVPTGKKDSITVVSDGDPVFGLLNYSKHDAVTVAYWSDANPRAATIISWRNYPLFITFILIGFLILYISTEKSNNS